MAARSLALTANARRPSAAGGAQPARKWTPSISVSVVSSRGRRPGRIAAASSPGPSRTRRSTRVAPRRRMIRAIHACSPTSRRRRATGASAEHRLDLVEEALREGMDLFARQPCELLEQLALAGRQLLRRLHDDTHQLVAAPVAVQVRDALALQAKDLPRLGAGRDLHARRALERGHLHLGPEGGLRDADRHLTDDVPSLAHEQGMLAHAEQHVEVARGAAVHPRLALAAELQTRAGVDPGGNLDVQLMSPALDTRAAARRARVGDDRPLPVAVAAGLGDREESLLEAYLPRAAALRTRPRHRPGLGASASSLKRSSGLRFPGFLSEWCWCASLRKAFLISTSVALRETPSTS